MQEHIHCAQGPGLSVEFLAVDSNLAAGNLFIGFQQQAAAAAGGVVDTVILFGLHQGSHQFGYLAGSEELTTLFAGVRCEHGDHILIGVADDVSGAQLAGTKIQLVEIFQQIAERGVFLLHFPEIHLGIEVNGPEHVAQLSAVVLFNAGQCYIDHLADLRLTAVTVQIIKGGLFIHGKALTAHGALHTAHITLILLDVLLAFLLGNIAEIFYKQHGQNVVLVPGTVDFAAEAVAGAPQNLFNVVSGCHTEVPRFIDESARARIAA